jgi:hypothetical protein
VCGFELRPSLCEQANRRINQLRREVNAANIAGVAGFVSLAYGDALLATSQVGNGELARRANNARAGTPIPIVEAALDSPALLRQGEVNGRADRVAYKRSLSSKRAWCVWGVCVDLARSGRACESKRSNDCE